VRPRSSRPRAAQPAEAFDTVLRLLARRDHSREELRRKLDRRGHDQQTIEAALRRITELGHVDDQAFARSYVRRRASVRGPLAIAAELAARGIDRGASEAALAGFDPSEQLSSATRLAERACAREPDAMSYQEMLAKVGTRLLRRGFPARIVQAACRAVVGAQSGDKDEAPL
jgi:regulatory protein